MTQTALEIELPTEKTKPSLDASSGKFWLYGPPKIGKTTTVYNLDPEHLLFLATEPGHSALDAFVQPVRSWAEFRAVGPALVKANPFKVLAIDTVDELYKLCTDQVMRDLGISHPSDLEYGKGWSAVTDEFRLRIAALCQLGLGVWFISHAADKDVKTRTGPITVTAPDLGGKASKWLGGFVDWILLARSEVYEDGERRVIRTQATENFEAGGRIPLPDPLELDAAVLKSAIATAVTEHRAAYEGDTEQAKAA